MTDAHTEVLNGNLVLLGLSCALIADSHRIHLLVSRVQFCAACLRSARSSMFDVVPYTAIDFAAHSAVSTLLRW
jgi:hypothetical protein